MDIEKTFEEKLGELQSIQKIAAFNPLAVDPATTNQLIAAYELKYIENSLETEEELKLVKENIDDFMAYEPTIQEAAINHAAKAKLDPDYFVRNKLDKELYKPIQIVSNINNKKEEVRIKNWRAEYYIEKLGRLREYKKQQEASKSKGFLARLFK